MNKTMIFLTFASFGFIGCGNGQFVGPEAIEQPRIVQPKASNLSGNGHTIMIVDSNIDPYNPAYSHLVKASYLLDCDFQTKDDDELFRLAMVEANDALEKANALEIGGF